MEIFYLHFLLALLLSLILQMGLRTTQIKTDKLREVNEYNAESGYREAYFLAKSHYENFPVVSLLVPKNIRKHLAIVYWFARTADDFADEGELSQVNRLNKLSAFENRLHELLNDKYRSDIEYALADTIKTKKLSRDHFLNLLKAFNQDVTKKRYSNFSEILEYCKNSANPVGRLVLELVGVKNEKAFYYSDKICTALQITNFIQDTTLDYKKGRIYYPEDEMQKFGVTEKMFELKENNVNFNHLVEFSIDRTQDMLNEGKNLLKYLYGRIRYEIGWTIKGGELIIKKIRNHHFDVLNYRPELSKINFLSLFIKSLFNND
jgi:squalene synthase HpnC